MVWDVLQKYKFDPKTNINLNLLGQQQQQQNIYAKKIFISLF